MVSFVADATHPGTDEAAWMAHLEVLQLATLELPDVARAIVIAPHPDDEVLAVGGLLRHLHRRGTELVIVSVTDGEGSHPVEPAAAVARTRRDEATAAYLALGIAPTRHALGIADGAVAADEGALATTLAELTSSRDLVVAPWQRDGHPDHDAAGRAAGVAIARTGAVLLAYPVWAWHWAVPGSDHLPLDRATVLPLDAGDRTAKAAAVAAFASQLTPRSGPERDPVLAPSVLSRFARPFEVLLTP